MATPNPVTPRSVTNKPGIRPLKTGSKADSSLSAICSLVRILTDIGALPRVTFTGVPVITTSFIKMVSFILTLLSAKEEKEAPKTRENKSAKEVFI
ncbi:MAG TPA: hypothetical protein DIW50_11525 [Prolixibacteraceae bacterium]|nr:hypothetical protein [Prolixibacteraceae bacterium]